MAFREDTKCRIVRLGGYVTKTWFFWGEERLVPVTFAFEVRYKGETHCSTRMSVTVYEQLTARQAQSPVFALSVGRKQWWWYRNSFYATKETYSDPEMLKAALLESIADQPEPKAAPRRIGSPTGREPANSPYAILGVERDATPDEIKQAYRQRIAEYHPDKVASLGIELRRVADEMTKKINHAYAELKSSLPL